MTKKRKKGRRVADVVMREKMEGEKSFETHTLGGNRCLQATLETGWCGGGEPGRKTKQTPAACLSQAPVSDSSVLL